MVNFGFSPSTKYWREDRKHILAGRLSDMVEKMRKENKITSVPAIMSSTGLAPYIEIDELYSGVRVRKITHLTEESQYELIKNAEKVYRQVMTGETS